jgi:MFS family permease
VEGTNSKAGALKKRFTAIVLISSFFVNFDSAVVIPIIANYAVILGASIPLAGIIVGVYSMVHIPSNIILGRIIDKVGRRVLLPIGVLLDGISLMLYFLAYDPMFLLFARFVHGIGGGIGGPSTMSYFSDTMSKEQSGRGMAFYGISIALSMLFGFMIGGFMSAYIGYRTLFFSIGLIMIGMSLVTTFLPEGYVPSLRKGSLRDEARILWNTVVQKVSLFPYISILAISFNLGIITASYAVILGDFGRDPSLVGMLLALMVVFSLIVHYPAGVVSDRVGKPLITVVGLTITSLSFVVLSISIDQLYSILGMILLGIGHGFVFPTSGALVRDRTSGDIRGLATGFFYALNVAGVAIGAPLSGFFYEAFGWQSAMVLGILVPFACIVFYVLFRRKSIDHT